MITLKQTQKAKIKQLVEKFNKAQENNKWRIFEVYEKPSQAKVNAYYNILDICVNQLNSYEYYIVGHNCNTFSMICKYIKWDNTKKQYEIRLRYWTAYNTYDCDVI